MKKQRVMDKVKCKVKQATNMVAFYVDNSIGGKENVEHMGL